MVVFVEDADDWLEDIGVGSQLPLLPEFSKELFKECELLNELELFKGLELFNEFELFISNDEPDEFRLALWCSVSEPGGGIGIGGGGLGRWWLPPIGDKDEFEW